MSIDDDVLFSLVIFPSNILFQTIDPDAPRIQTPIFSQKVEESQYTCKTRPGNSISGNHRDETLVVLLLLTAYESENPG